MDEKFKKLEWNDEMMGNFWDFESEVHQGQYFTNLAGEFIVQYFEKYLLQAKNVLDWGTGPGFLIKRLLDKNLDVYALDFSQNSISIVNEKYKGEARFKGAFLLEGLKKQNLKFDLIMLVEVIEHLNDQYLEQTFLEIKDFLSDNGICIITTPNDEDLNQSIVLCPHCLQYFHRVQHLRSWSRESLSEYVKKMGFGVVDLFTTSFSAKPIIIKRGWGQRIDEFISHRILKKLRKNRLPEINQTEQFSKLPHLACVMKK